MMIRLNDKLLKTLAFVGTLAYPAMVYYGMGSFSPLVFALLALFLLLIRLVTIKRLAERKIWFNAFSLAILLLIIITIINENLAVKAYPIIISLTIAGVFAFSLLHPPTIIERIARITKPNLSERGREYTRKATIIWLVFLLFNACISMVTALWGSLAAWTLWNGLISYILMGAIFAIEYIIRIRVQKCH